MLRDTAPRIEGEIYLTPTPLFQSPSPEDFCDLLRDLQPALSLPLMVTAISGPSETGPKAATPSPVSTRDQPHQHL